MPIVQVTPIYSPLVRGLCSKPYPGHPKGCPNLGKKEGCPPKAPQLPEVFDLEGPCYIAYTRFELGEHVARMALKHPDWSERQLRCCLYWQTGARKKLNELLQQTLMAQHFLKYKVTRCPEAMGLNVTQTLYSVQVPIEWPPVYYALQVAFLGLPAERK